MAHFARLGTGSIVKKVHVVNNDTATDEQTGINFLQTLHKTDDKFVQTSYNTYGGEHRLGGTPFRKNYAGIGYKYDQTRDAFIPIKPYNSWILNETTCRWQAPVAYPNDGKFYNWNEINQNWQLR
tara:strand:+ start:728 stop:1102 length:375 start_codon:yes stop_codon:yes gene_type:complete